MNDKTERQLIKKDAKLLLVQNFKSILLISLPLIIFEWLLQFMNLTDYTQYTWVQWTIFLTLCVLTLPCILCQSSFLLDKIQERDAQFKKSFSWLYTPQKWWKIAKIAVMYLGVFFGFALVMTGLYFLLRFGAVAFADFIANPDFLTYYKDLFLLLCYVGFVVVEVFTTPAINVLAQREELSSREVFSLSMKISRQNFKKLLFFKLTFVFMIIGVGILQMAGITNMLILSADSIVKNILYVFIGFIMYFAGVYLKLYMNIAMLSYVNLFLAKTTK